MPASSSVLLNVRDIEKSVEVYRSLGFEVAHETRDKDTGSLRYASLALDGAELDLASIASSDDAGFREWVSTPLGAGVLLYFSVADVKPHWKRAQKAGVAIETPLEKRSYGTVFTLNDPDGYVVTFIAEAKRAPARKKAARKAPAKKAAKAPARKAAKKAPARRRR